jgi:hypothetical protein
VTPPLLQSLQGGIEQMYRVRTELDVGDYLLDADGRDSFSPHRAPREQLLVRQDDGLELGLFVDERTMQNLVLRDPRRKLDESNLSDFMLAVEGVSHFIYLVCRAKSERPVSAVELELQAEVDKYLVASFVYLQQDGKVPDDLRARLYERVHYADDLSDDERDRYQLANSAAQDYTASLEDRFVATRAIDDLLKEVREFYRKGLAEKLSHITQV